MTAPGNDMEHDLRGRVVALEHASASKESRISTIEAWKMQKDITDAVRDEKFDGIKGDISAILDNQKWLTRLVIGALVVGVIGFILKGGLIVP